ncbi:hypothetical protein [Micromonospora sp. NBC_01796]|uniref:hypothetical protein n=1 Tax=Micromonospora sp. NBC_01796 TaxID=2975987 RepID=UPI002DDB0A59|nr:hypothetical protein [Micromonospora sp. NBC_01796]WSA86250.1 hypothetical protein OIE47_01120 [Micromonospora sp. NBC_01796]
MTDNDSSVWRDDERLPLRDLERAMGASTGDGQVDDMTGNEAGAEATFGNGAEADDVLPSDEAAREEMTDPERAYRPSTTGRNGPS